MTDDPPVPATLDGIEAELASLQHEMKDARGRADGGYWRSSEKQARYLALSEAKLGGRHAAAPGGEANPGDGRPSSLPVPFRDLVTVEGFATPEIGPVVDFFKGVPGNHDPGEAAELAINRAMTILENTPQAERGFLESSVAAFDPEVRGAMIAELASRDIPRDAGHASAAVLAGLEKLGCGDLLRQWGNGASRRVAIANARVERMLDKMPTVESQNQFVTWFNNLSGGELKAILTMMA